MGVFLFLFIVALWYQSYSRKKQEYNFFRHLLADRELTETEIYKLYKALKKLKKELHLILESEEVMKEAARVAGLSEDELRVKLGFDTDSLVQQFLKRQQELRKKWNAH